MSKRILTRGLNGSGTGGVKFILLKGLISGAVAPTPPSRRQQIIDQIKTLLATVTVANGFKTNTGSNVFEWKGIDFQESELPGVDVRDPDESVETRGQRHFYTLAIEIEAKVDAGTNTNTAREVLADIQTLMGSNQNLGGLAHLVRPVQNELLDFERAGNKFGSVSMRFEVQYATTAFQPYS